MSATTADIPDLIIDLFNSLPRNSLSGTIFLSKLNDFLSMKRLELLKEFHLSIERHIDETVDALNQERMLIELTLEELAKLNQTDFNIQLIP
jgi:uncharacterized membrane-anchored protein YjiN (DUF445 family)